MRSVLVVVLQRTEGIPISLVAGLSPLIFSGIDFSILLTGRQARRAQQVFRAVFVLNALAIGLNYAITICRRNACVVDTLSGGMGVMAAVFNVVEAGQLLAAIKIHFRKILRVFPPALLYGNASHVLVSPLPPGDKATITMSDGDVMLTPAMMPEDSRNSPAPGQRTVHFTAPSPKLPRLVDLWSFPGMLWVLISSVLDAAVVRAKPAERCWETLAAFEINGKLTTGNSALAVALVMAMVTIILSQRLGRVFWGWKKYWYRRNWVLVAVSFLRGFAFTR